MDIKAKATNNSLPTLGIYAVLDGNHNLTEQVSAQRARLATLTEQTSTASATAEKLTAQLKTWQIALDRHGRTFDGLRPTVDQVEALRLQAVAAGEAWHRLELEAKQANNALSALERELQDFRPVITPEMVLTYQNDLTQAENQVVTLDDAIRRNETIITTAQAGITPSPDLQTERENLLAEIACGLASEADLKWLDVRIKEAQQAEAASRADAEAITTPARQTISGLTRKREEAAAARDALLQLKPEIWRLLLLTEAERIGGEYSELAAQVGEKFRQLLALDSLLGNSPLRGYNWQNLCLPAFKVGPMGELPQYQNYNMLCDVVTPHDMVEARDAVRARLADIGINL